MSGDGVLTLELVDNVSQVLDQIGAHLDGPLAVQLGRQAFEAYCLAVAGETHDGRKIPCWDDLTDKVREGWIASASAVASKVLGELVDMRIDLTERDTTPAISVHTFKDDEQ